MKSVRRKRKKNILRHPSIKSLPKSFGEMKITVPKVDRKP